MPEKKVVLNGSQNVKLCLSTLNSRGSRWCQIF